MRASDYEYEEVPAASIEDGSEFLLGNTWVAVAETIRVGDSVILETGWGTRKYPADHVLVVRTPA